MLESSRRSISYPNPDRSDPPDIAEFILNLVTALELDVVYAQGTHAARPANPGLTSGYVYWETDTKKLFYWDGAAYNEIGLSLPVNPVAGDVPIYDGGQWTKTSDYKIPFSMMGFTGAATGKKFVADDGSYKIPPNTELAYVEKTTATSVSGATTVVTAPALTFDGSTVVIVTFFAEHITMSTTNNATLSINLYEDGADIGQLWRVNATGGGTAWTGEGIFAQRRITPASGSRTYSIRASQTNGTHTIDAGAGGAGNAMPAFIRIVTT